MIGTVIIRSNPVTQYDNYLANVVPAGAGYAELEYLEPPRLERRAEGGMYSLTVRVYGRSTLLRDLAENGLGRMLEVWGTGLENLFEGQIDEMVYNLPPDSFTISLRNMANKGYMRADYNGDGSVDRSTTIEDSDSQDHYGIKEIILAGGTTTGLSVSDQAMQQFVDLRAVPKPDLDLGGAQGDQEYLEIFARGFIDTLNWRAYNQTVITTNQGSSAEASDIVDSVGQFVARKSISPNATSVPQELNADRRAYDILQDNARLGDSSNRRWLVYMRGRTISQVMGREFVMEPASQAKAL